MAYDAARSQVVMFAGFNATINAPGQLPVDNQTWIWDGTNWVQQTPLASPIGRYAHSMTFDTAHQNIVLLGGLSSTNDLLGDTWLWGR